MFAWLIEPVIGVDGSIGSNGCLEHLGKSYINVENGLLGNRTSSGEILHVGIPKLKVSECKVKCVRMQRYGCQNAKICAMPFFGVKKE